MKKKMFFSKSLSVALSLSLVLGMLFSSLPTAAASEQERRLEAVKTGAYVKPDAGRSSINFNRDWKFNLGDVENGQNGDLDDSGWTDVALPHTFSLPYNMESTFYVGYGWYRKSLEIPEDWSGKRVSLDFEGSFQVTELFVNGEAVGAHEGGFTGFTFDITDYVHTGENQIAVRVNNIWRADLAPRAGDHQFTGGIYRDVSLTVTDDVHVAWYGTFVTTPDLLNPAFDASAQNVLDHYTDEAAILENIKNKRSNVRVQTEVKNDSSVGQTVKVRQEVVDKESQVIASFESAERSLAAGELYHFDAVSGQIPGIELWSPENPYVYTVYTTVYKNGVAADVFESPLGFRSAQYKNDAFYLNGEKVLLDGANVHQDHGGWGNAVTNEGFYRDVKMIKDCGMNFIRGSHYPHDPAFAAACDELGILFWSEGVFWGMGGCDGLDDPATMSAADWFKDAYPQNPADEPAFEASCKQALTEMIRVNRNHPSIINWSMGNEVFFTDSGTQAKAKALVNDMRNLSHQLDPTRKAAMGGVQREGYDSLAVCDIAGYNGDGGKFTNLTMPNLVAEYGSYAADRPGQLRPFYDQIQKPGDDYSYQLTQNSGGLVLWCGFHHGTIGGSGLAKMGMIDYYRLPLNSWYWYRQQNLGIAPEKSRDGEAVSIGLTATQTVLKNDGTDDAQLVVTLLDEDGNWVSRSPSVTLAVVDGPGVFPTGKVYTFVPNSTIRDGKAAIEFRSYFSGTTVIEASAPGLPKQQIKLVTQNVTGDETGEEPDGFLVTEEKDNTDKIAEPMAYGKNNVALKRPAFPSSNLQDAGLASDNDAETQWVASVAGSGQYWMLDAEFEQYFYQAKLDFKGTAYPYIIEISNNKDAGPWTTVAQYDAGADRPYEESLGGVHGRYLRVTFTGVPDGEYANLAEIKVYGNPASQAPPYSVQSVYVSDLTPTKPITQGWGGMTPGIDVSIEGKPITVGGVVYSKGLGLHANSEAVYDLGGKYTRFQSIIGIDDETNGNGDAIFRVYATIEGQAEQLIYEQQMTGGQSQSVDLSVSNVKTLRLVTDANGANGSDHTDWANARLLGAVRDISKSQSGYQVTFAGSTQKLQPGEDYTASLQIKNTDSASTAYTAALALYNADGNLCDVVMKEGYLSKGKTTALDLTLSMPLVLNGYEVRLNVFDSRTLHPYAETARVSPKAAAAVKSAPKAAARSAEATEDGFLRVDGEDAALTKVGGWTVWNAGADSGAYKGTETCVESSSWEGSSLTYTFTGTRVRVGAKFDQSQVGAQVYIDNVLAGTIDTRTETNVNEYKQAWDSGILADGLHTIKLVPTGKFGLDYIEYAGGWTKVDGEDAALTKEGGWTLWNAGTDSGAYMGTETCVESSSWQNSSASYTFTGSQVRVGAKFDQSQVGAEVYIDNVLAGTISTRTETNVNEYKQAWESAVLPWGSHTIKLVPTGKFGLDYIEYLGSAAGGEAVDKTALNEKIAEVETLSEADYTTASWKALQTALTAAQAVSSNQAATSEQVALALENLSNALDNLKKLVPIGDMTAIKAAMQRVLELIESGKPSIYTEESLLAVAEALQDGYTLYVQQRVEQEVLEEAAQLIAYAFDNLTLKQDPPEPEVGDRTELGKVIDVAKSYDLSQYVDDKNKASFLEILEKAQKQYDAANASQEQYDGAVKELLASMAGLRVRADKSGLDQWLEKLKAIDLSGYTQESADAVRAVIAKAQALAAQDLGEDEVYLLSAMIREIKAAEAGLQFKAPEEESSAPEDPAVSDKETGSTSGADTTSTPSTGDRLPIAATGLLVASLAVFALLKKKSK